MMDATEIKRLCDLITEFYEEWSERDPEGFKREMDRQTRSMLARAQYEWKGPRAAPIP